jgi:hypothetical protein
MKSKSTVKLTVSLVTATLGAGGAEAPTTR